MIVHLPFQGHHSLIGGKVVFSEPGGVLVVCLALGCEELAAGLFPLAFVEAVEVTVSVASVGSGQRAVMGGVECI